MLISLLAMRISTVLIVATGADGGGGGGSDRPASHAAPPPATTAMPRTARRATFIRSSFQNATASTVFPNAMAGAAVNDVINPEPRREGRGAVSEQFHQAIVN